MPSARRAARWCSSSGRFSTGTSGLGACVVSGRSRLPSPAASTIACNRSPPRDGMVCRRTSAVDQDRAHPGQCHCMPRPVRVVHLLDSVTVGGGARAVLNLARASARLGPFAHEVVCLRPASPEGLRLAREAGVPVAGDVPLADVAGRIAGADIVQVNYWNHPLLNRLLRMPLPPMRLVVWFHVAGDVAPQVAVPELVRYADVAVACSPHTAALPAFAGLPAARTAMIYPPADLVRVHGIRPRPHR